MALILAVVLALLLVQAPRAYSAESVAFERALSVIQDVLGLDVSAYKVELVRYVQQPPREGVVCALKSGENEIEVTCDFTDGELLSLCVFMLHGSPRTLQPAVNTISTAFERAVVVFRDIVGLDVEAYQIVLRTYVQDLFFETLPRESAICVFSSEEDSFDVACDFVDGKLQSVSIHIPYGNSLAPRVIYSASNELEMVKGLLDRYQAYCGASHCGPMRAMLDAVEANKNVTIVSGNVKFEASYSKVFLDWQNCTIDTARFTWIYTLNGVEVAHKCVLLGFENGYLKHFTDKWNLYKIGSYDINLSEEEAIEIAMNAAKNYSWNVSMGGDKPPVTVTEFNIVGVSETKLTYGNYIWKKEARDGDPLTLYPGWHIKLYFDKLYPGNVYGVSVAIWADTGEVSDIRTMFLMGAPDTTPPTIFIISPENKTYSVADVPLTFTVSESTSWMSYSLDEQANVTITGNTTLTGLSDGSHSLIVYAKDTDGKTGTSETIYFTIAQQSESFPITWIVGAIAIIAVVGAAFLVYFAKIKKTTGKAE